MNVVEESRNKPTYTKVTEFQQNCLRNLDKVKMII